MSRSRFAACLLALALVVPEGPAAARDGATASAAPNAGQAAGPAPAGPPLGAATPAAPVPGALRDLLPEPLVEIRWLEIALWEWIAILALVLLAALLSWLVVLAGIALLRPIVARSRSSLDDRIVDLLAGPVRLVLALSIFSSGLLALRLSVPVDDFFHGVQRGLLIVAVTWALMRLVDLFAGVAAERLAALGKASAVSVVPVGRKALKAVIVTLAVVAMLQNLGINVTGVIAGLGVGGLAVALAAQKTLENLFGGLTVIADQPVRVGDFCRFGDRVGIVEEIGLRSTRVRTLDRTVVAVPNAEFASRELENFARRDRIWLKPKIGLRYETTADQLRYVLVEIRRMLYAHERVLPEDARIRFVGFGTSSLDLEVFAYVRSTDFGEFLAIQEDILLRIMDIVAASGTGFAFPSSTTYLARDPGVDPERSRAAEARVREWRARGELPLPEFSPTAIEALRGTIAYPADGAPRSAAG